MFWNTQPDRRRRPGNAWGRPAVIDSISAALARYVEAQPDGPLVEIGDISRKSGGPLGGHLSHQGGRDVDVNYIYEPREDLSQPRKLDIPRSWQLVRAFLKDEQISVIFADYRVQKRLYEHAQTLGEDPVWLDELFQYPQRGRGAALLYHWKGHRLHFHARYRTGSNSGTGSGKATCIPQLVPLAMAPSLAPVLAIDPRHSCRPRPGAAAAESSAETPETTTTRR